MTPLEGQGITRLLQDSQSRRGPKGPAGAEQRGRWAVEVGEFLELVFVFITMFLGLGIMVLFGKWWER